MNTRPDLTLPRNLNHLRLLLKVAETGSLSRAASLVGLSQPAVTQAIAGIEAAVGGPVLRRGARGAVPTERGAILLARLARAFGILDPALADVSPALRHAGHAQLQALVALSETASFTAAAARLGRSQPTVHHAITHLERRAGRPLFDRTASGIRSTRPCAALAQAVRLALYEMRQAAIDLAEADGREAGRIVIGAMPLSRSALLPQALARFRRVRPRIPVQVLDGPYDDLLAGLRRGEIDLLVGALRDPPPWPDIVQTPLFDDVLVLLAGRGHPLAGKPATLSDLAACPWIVPRRGTPTRARFDALFAAGNVSPPDSIIESGSILLMRELLAISPHLGCISQAQAQAELHRGLVTAIPLPGPIPTRPIGLTTRQVWQPTAAQRQIIDDLRFAAEMREPPTGGPPPTAPP